MATGGQKENGCSLINVGVTTLEVLYKNHKFPWYFGIVVCRKMIFVIDYIACKVRLHRLQDGRLLCESDILKSSPLGICLINDTEIAVILYNGLIKTMSIDSTHNSRVITWTRNLHVQGELDEYHGVVSFKDNIVVCSVKQNTMCWCIVSINDGHVVGTIHQICKVKKMLSSFITTKDNIIYISCCVGRDSPDTGVYAYDVQNPSKYRYRYKHNDLKQPRGIVIDQHGCLFVCNYNNPYPCIHHLTSECQLVSIFTQGIPRDPCAIFWDNGHLYITCLRSNQITRYRTQDPDPIIPSEVLNMDTRSIEMYKKALRDGTEKVYNIRVMVVGPYDVGKTTLMKRLLGKEVNICDRQSTEGIDIQTDCCKVSLTTGEWITQEKNAEQYMRLQRLKRLVKHLNDEVHKPEVANEMQSEMEAHVVIEKHNNRHSNHDKPARVDQDIDQEVRPISHPVESTVAILNPEGINEVESRENEKKDIVMEIVQLVNENSDKLEMSMVEYASLGMWDFAGQYVFYTTHQTFLTSRAIYLLVIDLSQQITDFIKDDQCYLDLDGIKLRQVLDLIEIWMNSIHSCATSPQSGIPPVILVGTHVDKISEKFRPKVIDEYFNKLRYMLREKPVLLHLMAADFAIDNTQCDPKLEELKRMIFEMASKQTHWGEEKPARWLLLEQAIMNLKASGIKVASFSLIEEINNGSGSVRIVDKDELDLFLRFHHATGTILYFSVEGLRENIVLDPQWLIDAQKSLITAEMFIKGKPAIISKWYDFKEKGMLSQELIDAIWTEEENPAFYRNKNHILLLMEKMNIIAKPRSYSEDGKEIKVETFFLAPCMLQQTTPTEIISPEPHHQREDTSVLCYAFKGKYLPSPIFHRLIAACLTHWSIAKRKSENLIFCGCCVLDIDPCHRLTLYLRDYAIFARVANVSSKKKTPDLKLCIHVRDIIKENLLRIIGSLCHNLEFELHIQCSESEKDRVDTIFPVSKLQENEELCCSVHDYDHPVVSHDLLKFWFADEENQERDGEDTGLIVIQNGVPEVVASAGPMPSPPTSDTDRFMCIAYLLVDVGSRVLRQLLSHHTVTSTCTLDQYLGKHKSTINRLTRVINQSQMDIMFPPNGDDTNLDDYDITLLSALFQNIVPSLSQQEKDMIKRLREERNKLYGHAKSCQINASDFWTFWNDISTTLTNLSQQCGDTVFEAKIIQEIQRTQVSAITAGSYLDILKTWFGKIETLEGVLQNVTSRLQALESKGQSSESES